MSCSGTPGPPPKRLRSVDSAICSPMSITNPSTPGSYKPPTPASYKPPTPASYKPPTPASYKPPTPSGRPITPSSTQGPKTPQSSNHNNNVVMSSSNSDTKFAVPSPSMLPVSSQPQLLRQHSQSSTSINQQSTPCNLTAAQGKEDTTCFCAMNCC